MTLAAVLSLLVKSAMLLALLSLFVEQPEPPRTVGDGYAVGGIFEEAG